jgi:microsomal dipeptidase-like Zn-dependent dipeptidase
MTRLLIDGHNDLPYALRTLAAGPVSDADLERFDLRRGLPDAQTDLPRLAAGGVSAQFWSVYVPADLPEPEAVVPPPTVTVAQVADHVEHVREVAGIEHVGLGGDFDGCDDMPSGLADVSGYPRLFAELSGRGWSAGELAALAGGNVLRVLRAADDTAAVS